MLRRDDRKGGHLRVRQVITEHMEQRICMLFAAIVAGATLRAQVFSGTVVGEAGMPLVGATIAVDQGAIGAATDADGRFSFSGFDSGPHRVRISFVGYRSLDSLITLNDPPSPFIFRLSPASELLRAAEVEATRAGARMPIAASMLTRLEIARTNTGVDMPYLLEQQPSVVTTSDGGTGIGYTGLRIRGSDPTRINVTINGVPLNDAESATVYWVDLPDFASSTEDVQVQRGVGTSTNGPGAFGASVNLRTVSLQRKPFAQLDLGSGSFNMRRVSAQAGSGLINDRFAFEARLSAIQSDGYIDRATADLKSYFLQGAWVGAKRSLRFITFGGHEVTYQAWAGVPREVIDTNRTYNPYTYDNEVDDYAQSHYQLLFDQQLGKSSRLNITLFRVDGKGFFENYEADADMPGFGLSPVILGSDTITTNDLVQRRWLDNTLMGANASVANNFGMHELILGGSFSNYQGAHFGEVIWAKFFGQYPIRHRYYDNDAHKTDANAFARLTYSASDRVDLYGDLQWRAVGYEFLGFDADLENVTQEVNYSFINPKAGVVVRSNNEGRTYASVAVGNKEPNRDDLAGSSPASRPKAERLVDLEFGHELKSDRFSAGINFYYMHYTDQLVLTGRINDVGAYTRTNVPESYRAGAEIMAAVQITSRLSWKANATFSRNKILNFIEYVDIWDGWFGQSQVALKYPEVDISFSPYVIAGSEFGFRFLDHQRSGEADITLVAKYVGQQFLDNSGSKDRALDPYLVNDLRLNWTIGSVKGIKEIAINLTARNIFSELYESNGWSYSYVSDDRRQELVGLYPQAPLNLLGGVTIRF